MEANDIYHIFDKGGLLEEGLSGYEYREGQLEMALMVVDSYLNNAIAAIEAGTGIGKSFAYLVPAILNAQQNNKERTVVATSTINLQRQLFDKDIKQLFAILKIDIKSALMMGRNNYLCLKRLEDFVTENKLLTNDKTSELSQLIAWSKKTETGLRSDLPFNLNHSIWSEVCSDADLCFGYKCAYNKECFYFKAKKEAAEAQIIITNHHLLFTDSSYRFLENLDYTEEAILPPFSRLIIDEAHNIEKNATDFFTNSYSGFEINRALDRIVRRRKNLSSIIEKLSEYIEDKSLVDSVLEISDKLREAIRYLETYLLTQMQNQKTSTLLVTTSIREFLKELNNLALPVINNGNTFFNLIDKITSLETFVEELEVDLRNLISQTKRIKASVGALNYYLTNEKAKETINWFEQVMRGASYEVLIHNSPLSVAPPLKEALFSRLETVICTSATLDLGDDFNYWSSRVGLPVDQIRPFYKGVKLSPFDFKKQLLLLTPFDAPLFSEKNSIEYTQYCTETIKEALLASGGGSLVLFTSYSMLLDVAKQLEGTLAKAGIKTLKQGDADRFHLLNEFKSDQDSTLFATDSFWEGVDAPGDALRLVIITKLPFRVPTDPVFRARMESLNEMGMQGFFNLALPEATMRLKQGYGRLLRNTTDKGIVLILDSRVVHKQYGQWMLKALPESYHVESSTDRVGQNIESFLYN